MDSPFFLIDTLLHSSLLGSLLLYKLSMALAIVGMLLMLGKGPSQLKQGKRLG